MILDIPMNTMLADLDAALRRLLKEELGRHGFGGVNATFDPPTREWSSKVSGPTVNLFLYDLCEAPKERVMEWQQEHHEGRLREVRPPLMLQASYAVTAWTRAVEDEHRLLSQVIGILHAHPLLPREALGGALAEAADPPKASLARAHGERRPDFWTAIGGEYKASIDYAVVLGFPSGYARERGPAVRSRVLAATVNGRGGALEEWHTATGRVTAAGGEPAGDCWVTLPELGRTAVTDADGAFMLDGVPAGTYRCLARGSDGASAESALHLPGPPAELSLRAR